jgi:hypothetical protein
MRASSHRELAALGPRDGSLWLPLARDLTGRHTLSLQPASL